MSVSLVSAFKCDVCTAIFIDENKANTHLIKCLKEKAQKDRKEKEYEELEKTKDSVRFEAENLEHAIELIKQKAKKKYGLIVNITKYPKCLGAISNTHAAPIGFPTNWSKKGNLPITYLGFSGRWEGSIVGKCKSTTHDKHDSTDLHCLLRDGWGHGFNGFHSGTGCSGKEFSIGGYLFVDDFPKWKSAKGIVDLLTRAQDSYNLVGDNFDLLKQTTKAYDRFLKAQKEKRALQVSDLLG
jgi:hypothetical protein